MSVYLYEQALADKLREITGDERIHIVTPDLAVQYLAEFDKDKVQLPAIIISRNSVRINDTRNHYATLKGETARIEEDATVVKAKIVPITINWSINVYAVDRYTCDEIVRELVFYFLTSPKFYITVPYDLDIKQEFDVFLDNEIADNSDLVNFPNTGEYFRETLTIYTDNAHFYASQKQYPTFIVPNVEGEQVKWRK